MKTYDNHGPFPSITIASKTEEGSTNRAQEKCKCNGLRDVGLSNRIVFGKLDSLDGEGVEVKGIGSPC